MTAKGELLGRVKHRLGRAESNEHNVSTVVYLTDIDGIEAKKECLFTISVPDVDSITETAEVVSRIHSNGHSFTVPKRVVDDLGLKPGHAVEVKVYEYDRDKSKPSKNSDETGETLDIVNAISDPSMSDGVGSRLWSQDVCEYLGNEEKELILKNRENGKKTRIVSKRLSRENRFSFPKSARDAIAVTEDSTIEVISPSENKSEQAAVTDGYGSKQNDDRVDEIHEMVSEMYEAYLSNKND